MRLEMSIAVMSASSGKRRSRCGHTSPVPAIRSTNCPFGSVPDGIERTQTRRQCHTMPKEATALHRR